MKYKSKSAKRRPNLTKVVELQLPKDYPWKVLGTLATDLDGLICQDDSALVAQIVRDRDRNALKILSEDWGLQNNSKSPIDGAMHISEMRAKYQISSLLKKFQFDTDRDMRKANAIRKFKDAEAACQAYNQSGYKALCWGETENDAAVFTYARSFLSKVLGETCLSKDLVTRWSRHGPGSNLDTEKGQTSLYHKYKNWPYSCTKDAVPYARFLISTDKRWLGVLENSYRRRFNIPKHSILNQEVFWSHVINVVKGNRITFVPKNAETERSIAIEPTMNLMLQLGVDGFIRTRLKRWDINLDSQDKNQVLAYRGSINPGNNTYVTLDLAAASDSISLRVCEMLLPPEWYSYLCKLRSPLGTLGDEVISYEKISSMGNGFTFALESAIFAALCYAATKVQKGTCDFKEDMSVFGDDLIVRQDVLPRVIRALSNAGFKLNHEKSFTSGFTRESCGSDWVHGKPVRPVFFDKTPTDTMELFTDINRLKRILQLRWGLEESKTIQMMERWIPERFRDIVGPYSDVDFDSYYHWPFPSGRQHYGMWKHGRLTRQPISWESKRFLNRKLMHDLRGTNETISPNLFKGNGKRISTGGSRFTILKSYSYVVGKSYSPTSIWSGNYAEVSPFSTLSAA